MISKVINKISVRSSGEAAANCPQIARYGALFLARCGLYDNDIDKLMSELHSSGVRTDGVCRSSSWTSAA